MILGLQFILLAQHAIKVILQNIKLKTTMSDDPFTADHVMHAFSVFLPGNLRISKMSFRNTRTR